MTSASAITVVFQNRRALFEKMRAEGPTLSLFAPTPVPAAVGQEVRLDVRFSDSARCFALAGKVLFRQEHSMGVGQDRGLAVSFEGDEKRRAAELYAFCAGKPLQLGSAATARHPLRLPCLVHTGAQHVEGQVLDLSNGGAFVAVRRTKEIQAGAPLVLQLNPIFAGLGGKKLAAEVVWVGQKLSRAGFGVRFVAPSTEVVPVVRKFIETTRRG